VPAMAAAGFECGILGAERPFAITPPRVFGLAEAGFVPLRDAMTSGRSGAGVTGIAARTDLYTISQPDATLIESLCTSRPMNVGAILVGTVGVLPFLCDSARTLPVRAIHVL